MRGRGEEKGIGAVNRSSANFPKLLGNHRLSEQRGHDLSEWDAKDRTRTISKTKATEKTKRKHTYRWKVISVVSMVSANSAQLRSGRLASDSDLPSCGYYRCPEPQKRDGWRIEGDQNRDISLKEIEGVYQKQKRVLEMMGAAASQQAASMEGG